MKRTVRVRAIVEYDVEVPAEWTDEDLLHHRNEGSYCADSLVNELNELTSGDNPCLCPVTQFEIV